MCGFFGHVNWSGIVASHEAHQLFHSLARRGPDDRGYMSETWFEAGHTRLSIQDLSWRGHQPFQDHTGRFVTVYNGEIYNFREINEKLTKNGVVLRTSSDTETLIENFSSDGLGAFSEFHGMFSGAIFDREEKSLYLFRDRLGVKPIYYCISGSKIAFGSTPIIVSDLMGGLSIDQEQFQTYLAFRTPNVNRSMFVGVRALTPGTVLKCTQHNIEELTFWDVRRHIGSYDLNFKEEEAMEAVRCYLKQAVQKRLVADVPVGAFLSGGLDSTIVVHHMAEFSKEAVRAHTFSSLLNDDDETLRAQKTANLYKAKCEVVDIGYDSYLNDIVLLTQLKGAPLCVPNEYAIYKMSKRMKHSNTVVLSGEGSDEIFWGYSNIFTAASEARGVCQRDAIARWIFDRYRYVSPDSLKRIGYHDGFVAEYIASGVEYVRSIIDELGSSSLCDNLQYFFIRHHLSGLLMRLDNATMGASIEGRAPFTDHRLVELVLKIPPAMKLGKGEGGTSGKQILYNSYQDLPSWVTKTPKIGFKIGDTLCGRSEFKNFLHNTYPGDLSWFEDGSIPSMQKWHLTMLALFADGKL